VFLKESLSAKEWAAQQGEPVQSLPKWTWLVSLALLFHLAVIFITPNSQNYFGFRLVKIIQPYAGLFEFSSEWTFFSPDPAAPMYYEWKAYDTSGNELKTGIFPNISSLSFFADRQLRRLAAGRYMSMQPGALENTLVPYLCRTNPGASAVRLTRVVTLPTPLIDIIQEKKDVHDRSGLNRIDAGMDFCDSSSASAS